MATPEPRPGPTQRPNRLGDPRAASDPADDPRRTVPVQPAAISGQEDRPVAALADGQVDRPRRAWRQRDSDDLAAFAGDDQRPVAALDTQRLDVGTGGFGDPQPIEGQQCYERVRGRVPQAGGDQQCAELVTVQPDGMRLIVQAGTADMRGRGMLQQLFLHRVLVEPGDRAQPPGDGRPGPATGFQIAGEAFDISPARLEQAQVVLLAPGRVLAQIQRIRLPGQAGVTGQEPSQGEPFGLGEHRLDSGNGCGCGCGRGGHGAPPASG